MKIDATRYNSFYANPEKYRLEWVQNIRLKEPNEALKVGTAFHLMIESALLQWTEEELLRRLGEEEISTYLIKQAQDLYNQYVKDGPELEMVASEMEFAYQIPGSEHEMVGKIDQIVKYQDALWIHDFKTASPNLKWGFKQAEWDMEIAPVFYIRGAQHLGYDVKGELIQYVGKNDPPKVYPLIETTRSEEELNLGELHVHQTCEMIEMLLGTFGPNTPWPHNKTMFCSGKNKCHWGSLCGVGLPKDTIHFNEFFSERKEHLKIMEG